MATHEFEITDPQVQGDELAKVNSNITLKLWTKPHMSHINAYRSHSVGGQGLVLSIPKDSNPELVSALESGRETWVEVAQSEIGFRFLAHHISQEILDRETEEQRQTFLQEISKPFHPRKTTKAYVRTIGDSPLQEGMTLELVPEDRDFYVKGLGHPVLFDCEALKQTIQLTDGRAVALKVIRAVLTGYGATAVVLSSYSNKSKVMEHGVLKPHHVAEVAIAFVPRKQ